MSTTIVEPKPGVEMGRVVVSINVENFEDCARAERGEIPSEQVRRTTVESLVDSGATFFVCPSRSYNNWACVSAARATLAPSPA